MMDNHCKVPGEKVIVNIIRTPKAPPDAILFDLDNTLCDYIDAKYAACKAVIEYIGVGDYLELFEYFRRQKYNFEDTEHIHDYMKDKGIYSPSAASAAAERFEDAKIAHIKPYPGVPETLRYLADLNIKMAIVTDAFLDQAEKRLKKCCIDHYFPVVITPNERRKPKPDHTPFKDALQELRVTGTIWLVGDSVKREIIPGNDLGFITIYARYGDFFSGNNPDFSATYTLETFRDLLELNGLKKPS